MSRKIRFLLDDMWERILEYVPEDQVSDLAAELVEVAEDHEVKLEGCAIAEAVGDEPDEDEDDDEDDEDGEDEDEDDEDDD